MPLSGPLFLGASSEGLEQEVHPLICKKSFHRPGCSRPVIVDIRTQLTSMLEHQGRSVLPWTKVSTGKPDWAGMTEACCQP